MGITNRQTSFKVISPREASIFACIAETVLTPQPKLPPVIETNAIEFFDSYLAYSPKSNRAAYRVMVLASELAPRLTGYGARLRMLDSESRGRFFENWSSSSVPQLRAVFKLVKTLSAMSYYGDKKVLKICGYDSEANVARGRALRKKENRP